MARPLRIELAGGLYHVTSRGDRREPIYEDDDDRRQWLAVWSQACERYNWRCHAWCQMTNHYHVVVETAEANLCDGMRHLNGVYTQRFNRRHGKTGHVFQGRYKAILVERESYLLELARYVVLNPVRAGMVSDAGLWPWSSYGCMVGREAAAPWMETGWLLGQFGVQRNQAVRRYVDFVRAGVGLPSPWQSLKGQIYLGSDAFVDAMQRRLPDAAEMLTEVPRAQRRPLPRPLSEWVQWPDRSEAMALAYASGHYAMRQIAECFGVHPSTVSRAVKQGGAASQGQGSSAEGDASNFTESGVSISKVVAPPKRGEASRPPAAHNRLPKASA